MYASRDRRATHHGDGTLRIAVTGALRIAVTGALRIAVTGALHIAGTPQIAGAHRG